MEKQDCQVVRDLKEQFGDALLSTYTRAQAIDDGVLVDLSKLFPNDTRAYKHNVACTESVWEMIREHGGDDPGLIVWDLCLMSINWIVEKLSEREHLFGCKVPIGAEKPTVFKISCGPGDNYEPVITIMMPWED